MLRAGVVDDVTPSFLLVEAAFRLFRFPNERTMWGKGTVTGSQNAAEEKERQNMVRKKKQSRYSGI